MQFDHAAVRQRKQNRGQAAGCSIAEAQLAVRRTQTALHSAPRDHPGHAARHAAVALRHLAKPGRIVEGLIFPAGHQRRHRLIHQLLSPPLIHLWPGPIPDSQAGEAIHCLVVKVAGIHRLDRPFKPPLRPQAMLDKMPEGTGSELFQPGDRGALCIKEFPGGGAADALHGRPAAHGFDQGCRAGTIQMVLPHPCPGSAPALVRFSRLKLERQSLQSGHRCQRQFLRVVCPAGHCPAFLHQLRKQTADRFQLGQWVQRGPFLPRQSVAEIQPLAGRGQCLEQIQRFHLFVTGCVQPEITAEYGFRLLRFLLRQQSVLGRCQDAVIQAQHKDNTRPVGQKIPQLTCLNMSA